MNPFALPAWPAAMSRVERPFAGLARPAINPRLLADHSARDHARATRRRNALLRNGGTTTTWSELMWVNTADYSAVNTTASEASLLGGVNDAPTIPALYFYNKQGRGRAVTLIARGILGTTSTPTIIFQVRFGTTSGSSFLSGTSVAVGAAITTASGVSNKYWELRLDLVCNTPGIGTGNCTLSGAGYVMSPGGFASPFIYPLEPTTPDTATWTSTIDGSLTQYVNLSATWSASSASNTITCKQLMLIGWN
jgi:hypothetical protein